MKIYRKILDVIKKIASLLVLICILGIVVIMLSELAARNIINTSFRWSTELNGFLFMWMSFIGLIVLYDDNRMINLDMVYSRVPEKLQTVFWMINKIFSFILGVAMVLSYCSMYPILSTSHFATMHFLTKAYHFLPMAIAGGFIAFDTIYQVVDRILTLTRKAGTEK